MQNNCFREKYELYGEMLYKIAFLYLRNKPDSEDALQEVFIKLLYRAPTFQSQQKEKAWLIRVLSNICRNMLKKRKKYIFCDEEFFSEKAEDQNLGEILNCVMSVAPKYRIVIHLHYYMGYSVSEISKILGISGSAVKMRLKRGREILKEKLEVQ